MASAVGKPRRQRAHRRSHSVVLLAAVRRAAGCGRLCGANERAHEFAVDLGAIASTSNPWPCEEGPRIFDIVNPRRFDIDLFKTGFGELVRCIRIPSSRQQCSPPKAACLRYGLAGTSPRDNNIGNCKRPPGFSTRKASRKHAILVCRKVNHAVGNNDVD